MIDRMECCMKKIILIITMMLLVGCSGDKTENDGIVEVDTSVILRSENNQKKVDDFLSAITISSEPIYQQPYTFQNDEEVKLYDSVGINSKLKKNVLGEDVKQTLNVYTFELDQNKILLWYKVLLNDGTEGYSPVRLQKGSFSFYPQNGYQIILEDNKVVQNLNGDIEYTVYDDLVDIDHLVVVELHDITHYEVISCRTGMRSIIEGEMILSPANDKVTANYQSVSDESTMYSPEIFSIHKVNDGLFIREYYLESSVFDIDQVEWMDDNLIHITKRVEGSKVPFELVFVNQVWVLKPIEEPLEDYFPEGVPQKVIVDVTELNIRTEATIMSESIGKAEKDKVYEVKSISIDYDGMVWLQVDDHQWLAEMYTSKVE